MQGRPFLGAMDVCPFTIGCTNFALITLENYIVPVATLIIIKRLLLCNPISILVLSYAKR
ncbi:membrane protein insertion efficiency factor YidD [Candidatus Babeliales bacterium]|nr:membrane protein insertion efficiency factor YidD [Candidatus Babeliales bacterium]